MSGHRIRDVFRRAKRRRPEARRARNGTSATRRAKIQSDSSLLYSELSERTGSANSLTQSAAARAKPTAATPVRPTPPPANHPSEPQSLPAQTLTNHRSRPAQRSPPWQTESPRRSSTSDAPAIQDSPLASTDRPHPQSPHASSRKSARHTHARPARHAHHAHHAHRPQTPVHRAQPHDRRRRSQFRRSQYGLCAAATPNARAHAANHAAPAQTPKPMHTAPPKPSPKNRHPSASRRIPSASTRVGLLCRSY